MTSPSTARTGFGAAAPLGSYVRLVLREPAPGFGGERPVVLGQVTGVLDGIGEHAEDPYDVVFLQLRGLFGETAAVRVHDVSAIILDPTLDPRTDVPDSGNDPSTVATVAELHERDDAPWVTVWRYRSAVQDADAPEEVDTVRATGRLVAVRPFKGGTGGELRLYPILPEGNADARHAAEDDLPMTIDVGANDYTVVYDRP